MGSDTCEVAGGVVRSGGRQLGVTVAFLSASLVLTACGTSIVQGQRGSTIPPSWVSRSSSTDAIHLTLDVKGSVCHGRIDELLVTSGSLATHSVAFRCTIKTKELLLKLNGYSNVMRAAFSQNRLVVSLPNMPSDEVLSPGTSADFHRFARRVQRNGERLALQRDVTAASRAVTSVSALTSEVETYAPNVLGADVSLLEGDQQQAQSNLSWTVANAGTSGGFFSCLGYSSGANTLSQARRHYASFEADVSNGDAVATQLEQAILAVNEASDVVRVDEAKWNLNATGYSDIEAQAALVQASSVQSQWPISVSAYDTQASAYLSQTEQWVREAEDQALAFSPTGC